MQIPELTLAPRFSAEAAVRAVSRVYGINGNLQPLPSERDQNFLLTSTAGQRYVLKIANQGEDEALLDCQNEAMAHLGACLGQGVCPQVLPTLVGERMDMIADHHGNAHCVRLLTYLPGKPLALARPHDSTLLNSVGYLVGKTDKAFADFDHAATRRRFHWDLRLASTTLETHLECLSGTRRQLIGRYLERFRVHTEPSLAGLRTGVIHNDANDYNVMVSATGRWGLEATGLIDFGDMVRSYTVAEPAIAATYAMLSKRAPLPAATAVIAGYHRANPLHEEELAVIYDLICMRLCTSACIAVAQQAEAPDNDYLAISQGPVWALLTQLVEVHPNLAWYSFREACGLKPNPKSDAVMSWLERNRSAFHPVVDADLDGSALPVVDFSVASPLVGGDHPDPNAAPHPAAAPCEQGKSTLLTYIGRYGEPRAVYATPAFEVASDELPERRTVHMGVDVFQSAGAPVCAPLPGRIHSFADNARLGDYGPTIILEHDIKPEASFYTLYGHLSRSSLHGLQTGRRVEVGGRIGTLGDSAENGGWPPHLHFQLITDLLGEEGTFPGVAAPSALAVWISVSPDPGVLLGIPENRSRWQGRDPAALKTARLHHLGKALSLAYEKPLNMVRGVGQFLYDESGQAYLDCVNNVCHVGHCHPRVVRAGQQQMAVLNTNTRFLHKNIVAYAENLLATLPAPLSVVYLVCSGSEANELALRMARAYTGRTDVIVLDAAYHGNTQTLIDISPYKHNGPGGRGAPAWVHTVPLPDPYRGSHQGYGRETGERYAQYVSQTVRQLLKGGTAPAAFIAESVPGCGGQIILPDGYLHAAYQHVRRAGGVCIADEVQVGFGRVGCRFWAFETQDVVPDIVTLGKSMGNGHPLAAVITTPAIADAFANGMEYFNTFGGNPVSCAIGQTVLEVIEDDRLQQHAQRVGDHLLAGLRALMNRHPLIGDVRGLGLFLGVELVRDRVTLEPASAEAGRVVERMRDHGVLLSIDGPMHNVIKLKPPLVFTMADADRVVATLDSVLSEDRLQAQVPARSQ